MAELKRRKEEEVSYDEDGKSFASYADRIHYSVLDSIQDFLDTIEVKEVDLKKEIDDYLAKEWEGIEGVEPFYGMIKDELSDIARHFFELGLKVAQKGEEV